MKGMGYFAHFLIWILTLFLIFQSGRGFYVPPGYRHWYIIGDSLTLKVNSLTYIKTALPLSHYSLPFCMPQFGGRDNAMNLGQHLMGDRIQASPYRISMYINESEIFLCESGPLSIEDVNLLKKRIDDRYQVNLILDGLPAMRYVKLRGFNIQWFPVGIKIQESYYLYNHLKLKVLVHREDTSANWMVDGPVYTIVGFEVAPCSFRHNALSVKSLKMYDRYPYPIECDPSIAAEEIKENEKIAFSYEVTFEESDIKWQSRWDTYLLRQGSRVHWFLVVNTLNSLLLVASLSGYILVKWTNGWNVNHYERIDEEGDGQLNEKLSGSLKLVMGDVSNVPACPMLLCVMVGDGVQILGTAFVTVLLAALGFMSPASRGTLLTVMIFLYLVLGIAAGYVAARLWRTIGYPNKKGWVSVSWRVACFFPSIALLILIALNFILASNNSAGAISLNLFGVLILLWLGISVPLTLIGGYVGARTQHIENHVPFHKIPREVPIGKSLLSWLFVLLAGLLPFSTLFLEFLFILSSFWMGRYYEFGFLLIFAVLLVVVCADISIFITCERLNEGDWQWWWKSFFASGSVAIYLFSYLVIYLANDLRYISGPASAALYLGYSLLVALAIMLATGAVGFLSTFWFLHYVLLSATIPEAKAGPSTGSPFPYGNEACDP